MALGALQGLTEFLPVSSSGHLTLGQALLGWSEPNLLFDVVVHVGTLVAVVGVFRADVARTTVGALKACRGTMGGQGLEAWTANKDARLAALVLIGTLPTALIGGLMGDVISGWTATPRAVGVMLLVNGCLLMGTRWLGRGPSHGEEQTPRDLSALRAVVVGIGQGLAVLRGVSRSGTTIALGLLLGMGREEAARFSFLLSIPAILGALVLKFDGAALAATRGAEAYGVGFVVSAAVGWGALRILLRVVRRGALHLFAPYCWLLGVGAIILAGRAA